MYSLNLVVLLSATAAFASHQLRNHNDLAKRVEGTLSKRFTAHQVTWYPTDTGPDFCTGRNHGDNDNIVALNVPQFGSNGNGHCGKKIRITSGGKTAIGVIQDKCASCFNVGEIDLTRGLFQHFAPLSKGVIQAQWEFIDGDGGEPEKPKKKPAPKPTPTPTPKKVVRPKTTSKPKASPKPTDDEPKSKPTDAKVASSAPVSPPTVAPPSPSPSDAAVGNAGAGAQTTGQDTSGISGGIASDGLTGGAISFGCSRVVAAAAAFLLAIQIL